MPLIVYSRSTEDFARQYCPSSDMDGNFLKVSGSPTKETLKLRANGEIIAIGGGSVIDTAKIIAMNSKAERLLAVPTTASGAVKTSHAVYWDGYRKYSVNTPKPFSTIIPTLLKTLPKDVIRATSYDALSQALESYWSKKATNASKILASRAAEMVIHQIKNDYPDLGELVRGGNLSGEAVEITGTNIVHAISYPITAYFNVPHSLAVGLTLQAVAKYMGCKIGIPIYEINLNKKLDVDLIANEAMTYPQIHDTVKDITKEQVVKILEESL